jgi:HlyD family secretion protein
VPLMTVMNLDEVNLVIYVPQAQLPRIKLEMPVQVTVDAYPGQTFIGHISSIARRAQFSSRDTQAREDRANMVFAVKVRLPNPDHRLKAGMNADAVIELQ